MSSHAKNACSSAVFSYHERRRLKEFGTQRALLSRESLKDFDVCGVCLSPATDPVCCAQGHLFCRECAVASLLAQRTEQQRKAAEAASSSSQQQKKKQSKKGTGACFWIPSETPEAAPTAPSEAAATTTVTLCPGGAMSGPTAHRLRLKQLIPVRFSASETEPGRKQCPVCLRTLSNARRCALPRECGHVACAECLVSAGDEHQQHHQCTVCGKPFTPGSVVRLEAGGTGFAGHGDALQAQVFTPAARV